MLGASRHFRSFFVSDTSSATLTHNIHFLALAAILLVLACAATLVYRARRSIPETKTLTSIALPKADESEATHEQVMEICAACHKYPPPEIFAKDQWHTEVARGFDFFRQAHMNLKPPSQSSVVRYYETRAPAALPVLKPEAEPYPFPVEWQRIGYHDLGERADPGIANVHFVHLTDDHMLDVVACDMMRGKVFLLKPY